MFNQYFMGALRQYSNFKGRSSRAEYWWFLLFITVIGLFIIILDFILFDYSEIPGIIFSLAMTLPCLAALVRRLHDTGRSGWWYFISLIPVVGGIILIVFLCQKSEPAENKWGSVPVPLSRT
ncbi:TPA: DUF805 domain-containing protein [Citrobacter freundii]|nr:DUF805 domain-containing protein [Citrobacter freundii]